MSGRSFYKAKRIDWEEWVEEDQWVYGNLVQVGDRYFIAKFETYERFPDELNIRESVEVDPSTICQFTGLYDSTKWEQLSKSEQYNFLSEWNIEKDRNNQKEDWKGKKIWENDVVEYSDSGCEENFLTGIVIWEHAEWRIKWNRDMYFRQDLYFWATQRALKVLGNVFDNPALVNKQWRQ